MCRSPVEKDADALLVAAVDKVHQVRGPAVAAGGGKVADRLVAPGAVERVLHHRQQLNVRVAHLLHVWDQRVGQLAVAQPAVALFPDAAPRAQVDLIDRNGRLEPVGSLPRGHPGFVAPRVAVDIGDDRSALWPQLRVERVRVGLQHQAAQPRADLELVDYSLVQARNKQLPDPGRAAVAQWVHPAVPVVEVTDYADALRVWRPNAEMHALDAGDLAHVRPELVVFPVMGSFADQVQVEIREQRGNS